MKNYIAIIHKEKDSSFGVNFPDFPGCITAGDSLEEARINAAEALIFHIEGMKEDGESIPEPSTMDDIFALDDYKDGVAFAVAVFPKAKDIRVNVMLDEDLLQRIDSLTNNRSAWLKEAARRYLEKDFAPALAHMKETSAIAAKSMARKSSGGIWREGKGTQKSSKKEQTTR